MPDPARSAADVEPRWRLLEPNALGKLGLPLGVLAAVALVIGLVVADEPVASPLLALGCAWGLLRLFLAGRADLGEHRRWLVDACVLAFFLRVVAAVVIYSGPWDRYRFSEDQLGYDSVPRVIAGYWEGLIPYNPYASDNEIQNRFGYYGLVAVQFYVFGPNLLVPRVFNCLGGALIVYYAYRLAALAFGTAVARVAALWCVFLPSLVLWSSLNMRDIWLAVSIVAIFYHALRCRERMAFLSLIVIVGHLIWLQNTRFYLVVIMGGAVATMLLPMKARHLPRDIFLAILFVLVVLGLRQFFGLGQDSLEWLDLDRLAQRRSVIAGANVGMSGYLPGIDLANPMVLIPFTPLAIVYFLYSPFPWQLTAFRRLITVPDLIVWYWMIPSLWVAIRTILRDRVSSQIATLLATTVVTMAFSITSSNVGLAYRYRAQVIAPLVVLAAAGYQRRRAARVRAARTIVPRFAQASS